jgi:CBS domain-containing protein
MQLKDVMSRDVEVVHPNATLAAAAAKMEVLDVGLLPVCDGTRLVGMVSDRDITVRASAMGKNPKRTRVREVMTEQVIYGFEEQDTLEAGLIMAEQQIRRLVVLDRDKRLVGIVSLGDLAVATHNDQLSGEILERVSEPAEPNR